MDTFFNAFGQIGAALVLMMAGAAWRWWDGGDGLQNTGVFKIFQHTLVRLAVAVVITAIAVQVGIGWLSAPIISLSVTIIAVLSLHMGYTKWGSGRWQMLRFGLPALAIAALAALTGTFFLIGVAYVVACGAAGWAYSRIPENLARLPMGATLGLLALF